MRLKIFLVIAFASSSLVMAFAAGKVETCADKYKQCSETSTNAFYQCKATGRDPAACDKEKAKHEDACNTAKAKCEKENPAQGAKPKPKK